MAAHEIGHGMTVMAPDFGSEIGGVPEVVLDKKTGLLVEPGDLEALVEALTDLLTNESYRCKLGDAAFEHAKTFSWKQCAEITYGS